MAVVKKGTSVTMTAITDTFDYGGAPFVITGMSFQGTGLTAAQRLRVTDGLLGTGNVLADYVIEAATDNADLFGAKLPQTVTSVSIENNTLGGVWTLTFFVRGF